MDTFNLILIFIFGSMLGSFLNVVIYRLPREKSIIYPNSRCPKCNRSINFYDNIPIFSWLFLGGKCRYCKEPINIRYPLNELITALLLCIAYLVFGLNWKWIFITYFISLLIVISWIDIDYMLILDSLTYPGIVLGLVYSFFDNRFLDSLIGGILGYFLLFLVAKISLIFLKKEGMGLGDAILASLIGAWLGVSYLFGTFFISFFLGSIVGIILYFYRGKSDYFPFGPFLAIGSIVTFFSNNYLFELYLKKINL
jgi:leader peptidase (prepilin peptidase)/N-methyltransferase